MRPAAVSCDPESQALSTLCTKQEPTVQSAHATEAAPVQGGRPGAKTNITLRWKGAGRVEGQAPAVGELLLGGTPAVGEPLLWGNPCSGGAPALGEPLLWGSPCSGGA